MAKQVSASFTLDQALALLSHAKGKRWRWLRQAIQDMLPKRFPGQSHRRIKRHGNPLPV